MSKSRLAEIKKLHQKKYRDAAGAYIIEGWKSVEEALNAGVGIKTAVYDEQKINDTILLSRLKKSVQELIPAKSKVLESISDAVTSQGIVAVLPMASSSASLDRILKKDAALIVALDGINDPGNLGTIVRTCDWFGVDALAIGTNSVDLYNPKVVRATMGSLFHFPVFNNIDLPDMLAQSRTAGFSIYTAELTGGTDMRTVTFTTKSVLVIGNESRGVSKEISGAASRKIFIPKIGTAESLNAAIACGIILSRIRL